MLLGSRRGQGYKEGHGSPQAQELLGGPSPPGTAAPTPMQGSGPTFQESLLVPFGKYNMSPNNKSKSFKTQVANAGPTGRIQPSALFYLAQHLVSIRW